MNRKNTNALADLRGWLKERRRVVVAFSGGVDSSLLAFVSHDVLGRDMIAITGESATLPSRDRAFVGEFCARYGIKHSFIETGEFDDEEFRQNPKNRCYFCKRGLFNRLSGFAVKNGFDCVLDGTNVSDLSGHRPGYKAIKELQLVKTPFIELGITKSEIRKMASSVGLDISEKPASACLASRIPWGNRIEEAILRQVDSAENALRDIGINFVRVRHHGEIARIQTTEDEFGKTVESRKIIEPKLAGLGYKHVTIDLKCYGEE